MKKLLLNVLIFALYTGLQAQSGFTAGFTTDHSIVFENDGATAIPLVISNNVGGGQLIVTPVAGNALISADFELLTDTLTIAPDDTAAMVMVQLVDNNDLNNATWVAFQLEGSMDVTIDDEPLHVLYIQDDDRTAMIPSKSIELEFLASYLVADGGSAEIVEHEGSTQRLYVVNSSDNELVILDFSNPAALSKISSIDMSVYGAGINSVAVRDSVVAVAVEAADQAAGSVVLLDLDGNLINSVAVGVLPDNLVFTPDGQMILTANEGEPNDAYTVDPEGSISIIDISGGAAALTQAEVTTLDFNAFDSLIDDLRAEGVRIYGPNASVSQDLEPEYIAVSDDGTTAYVTLQENNALAVVDLVNPQISAILPLGFKDHSLPGNGIDGSDRTDSVIIANWPLLGMYQPDAIDYININGQGYLLTANEGDSRDYDGYSEEEDFGDLNLDPAIFPTAEILQENIVLGRIGATNANGDVDNDGDFDQVYINGSRSFSVWAADGSGLVWDSGEDLERLTAEDPTFGVLFNASNSNNTFKNRSDNKGPEPESILTATIMGVPYVFIGLERIGGIVTYDLSDPTAPVYVDYVNSRTLGEDEGGDLGPEGLTYVSPELSPTDTGLIVVANEVSATISVFSIGADIATNTREVFSDLAPLKVFPNPAVQDIAYFNRPVSYSLFDQSGRLLWSAQEAPYINVNQLPNGWYVVRTEDGASARFVVQR